MKFLLLQPPVDQGKIVGTFSHAPPLGLLYIAKVLEENGHDIEILDFVVEEFTEKKLLTSLTSADAIGMTITAFCVENANMISSLVKKTDPHLSIMIGGPLCCIQPEQTLLDINADICVEGEGEKIIGKIAEALEGKISFKGIPGVYFREGEAVKKGLPAEIIKDLDSISFPARHLVDKYNYGYLKRLNFTWLKGKLTSLITSRGCPFNCKFCCVKAIAKKYRMRSPENVIKEMEEINDKYDSIYIRDDNFFINKKRAEKILDLIVEKDLDFEFWVPGVRVSLADEKLFLKMKKAGVKIIQMGIESGNKEVLDFYSKRTSIDEIEKVVNLSRKMGFITGGNFILGAPFETESHFEKTLDLAKRLPLELAFFFPLVYYKGSELWDNAFKEGKIKENECMVKADSGHDLSKFSQEELSKWCMDLTTRFYLRPNYIIDQVFQSFLHRDWRFYKVGFEMFCYWLASK